MKKNKILMCILKWMPLYMVMLLFMFISRYINSLTGLFIGEFLGIFNSDNSVLPGFISRFIVTNSLKDKIVSLAIIYVIVTIINVINLFMMRLIRVIHFEKLYVDLSTKFYNHVIDIEKSEYASRSTGDIIQRNIEDCRRVPLVFSQSLYDLFRIIFGAATMLFQIYALTKSVFVISLISLLICIGFASYYGYFKIKKKEKESSKYYSELNSTIQQSITNYSLVKSFANEEYEFEKFKKINDLKESNTYLINNLRCKYWLISDMMTSIYYVTCLSSLAYSFFNGNISIAIVSACIVICGGFLGESTYLMNHINKFVRMGISIRRLNEYFKIESEYIDDGNYDNIVQGDIEFENVSMKYEDGKQVLNNISFKLKKGETLGIVGKSGSGKTSIVNLLTRLDDYYSGSITIDGVELREYKKKCIRENIGVVLQDAYIFSKSIKENLLVLIDNDHIDLDMHLKGVGLDEDINKFDNGLETIVGERGVTLSGGQRQRLSLLRTMLKNKKILILDDTLSAVDNVVARKIKDSISKESATTIIISHNLLNVKDADKILVLEQGEVVDIGTHEELVNREGFYSNVWNLQQMIKEVEQ